MVPASTLKGFLHACKASMKCAENSCLQTEAPALFIYRATRAHSAGARKHQLSLERGMLGDLLRPQKAAALYRTTSGANNCVCKAGIVLGSSIQAAISLEPQAYSCDASCKTPCCSTSLTLLACLHTETDQKSYSRIRGSYTRIVLGLQIHTLPYSGLTPCVDKPLHKQE